MKTECFRNERSMTGPPHPRRRASRWGAQVQEAVAVMSESFEPGAVRVSILPSVPRRPCTGSQIRALFTIFWRCAGLDKQRFCRSSRPFCAWF
jgi:hypothetical protein